MYKNLALEISQEMVSASIDWLKELPKIDFTLRVLVTQYIKSITSIEANLTEGRLTMTRKDFIAKISIARREAAESIIWLRNLSQVNLLRESTYIRFHDKTESVLKILNKTISTCQKNQQKKQRQKA